MYTVEGCLYKELNKSLRYGTKNEMMKIKYYYVTLLAAFTKYNENTYK